MSYAWVGENWGRSMIRDAIKAGYEIEVNADGDQLYKGTSPKEAWAAVISVDECHVFLRKEGEKTQWAFIVLEYNQNGDEVINDHSCGVNNPNWIEQWWKAKSDAQWAKEARS